MTLIGIKSRDGRGFILTAHLAGDTDGDDTMVRVERSEFIRMLAGALTNSDLAELNKLRSAEPHLPGGYSAQ